MSAVVEVEMIITVKLQQVEVKHESLQDGVCLERNGTVQVSLVAGPYDPAVYLSVLSLKEVVFA